MKAERTTMMANVMEGLRLKESYSIWLWRALVGAALLIFWQWAAGTLIRETYWVWMLIARSLRMISTPAKSGTPLPTG